MLSRSSYKDKGDMEFRFHESNQEDVLIAIAVKSIPHQSNTKPFEGEPASEESIVSLQFIFSWLSIYFRNK